MEFKNLREEKAVYSLIELLKEGGHRKATLKLGELRGKPDEFMKLFDYLVKESSLREVKLKIKPVRARVNCLSCDWKGDPEMANNSIRCPRCRSDVEILQGNEFHISL